MKKAEFEHLYKTMSNKELAKKMGVTQQTIINYVKKLGIKPKGSGNPNPVGKKRSKIIIED